MRTINEIVVHTTATPANWRPNDTTAGRVAAVRSWHVSGRGWSDIGYHYLIDRDGTVAAGRPVEKAGAHVAGRNANTIGIALFGGIDGRKDDAFADNYTAAQDRALRQLIEDLQDRFGPGLHLSGHHEYANKACPCFDVREWYAERPLNSTQEPEEPDVNVEDSEASYSADYRRLRWRLATIRDTATSALNGD